MHCTPLLCKDFWIRNLTICRHRVTYLCDILLQTLWVFFGISFVSTVDHTTCPHRHTHIQLRNVSHIQPYRVFCLFCLRGIRRGLGVTTDRLFGIHTSLSLLSFPPPPAPLILYHSLHSSVFLFSHKPLFVYIYLTSSSNGLFSPFTQCLSRFQVCINTFWMPRWLEQGLFSLRNTPKSSPPHCRKYVVTLFPGLPPAEPLPLTRNIQLIYPWLLGGLWSCVPIGSIWE